jgi:hypothetical protein
MLKRAAAAERKAKRARAAEALREEPELAVREEPVLVAYGKWEIGEDGEATYRLYADAAHTILLNAKNYAGPMNIVSQRDAVGNPRVFECPHSII